MEVVLKGFVRGISRGRRILFELGKVDITQARTSQS